ncbi:MAG: signal peptide peptidase SppA [Chloroflexi bacterium]|nr:MAG: signal peptide peptidase SppA [Chloroflexota bacterium]
MLEDNPKPETTSQSDDVSIMSQPVREIIREGNGRTPFWVLLGVVVGFLLPVCSCILFFATTVAMGTFSRSDAPAIGTGDAVAVVRVEGTISSSDKEDLSAAAGAVSGVVISDLKKAAADPTVKAIVLRVDSPGGTVTGSAQIYEAILEMEKPVVVSMASVAASGGYYVSAPADYIFARPDTVTGSIGVILTIYNAKELLNELGVDVISITSGPNKALGSFWEEMTPEQQQILEDFVQESYDEFVRVVAEGRNMSEEEVRELADGRIYTGRQALENGLVDELGNLEDAIQKAAELGGITGEPRIVEYEHLPSFTEFLTGFSSRLNRSEADAALEVISEFTTPKLEYRYVGPGSE